jgi:hypothetical protein
VTSAEPKAIVALQTKAGLDQLEIMGFSRNIADLMNSGLCKDAFLGTVSSTPLWYTIQDIE